MYKRQARKIPVQANFPSVDEGIGGTPSSGPRVRSSGKCSRYSEKLIAPSQVSTFGKRRLRRRKPRPNSTQAARYENEKAFQPEVHVCTWTPFRLYSHPTSTPAATTNPQASRAGARRSRPCCTRWTAVPANIVAGISKVSNDTARLFSVSSTRPSPPSSRAPAPVSFRLPLSTPHKPRRKTGVTIIRSSRTEPSSLSSSCGARVVPIASAAPAKATAITPLCRCRPRVNRAVTKK